MDRQNANKRRYIMIKTLTLVALLAASVVTLNVGMAVAANSGDQSSQLLRDRSDHRGFANYIDCIKRF